MTEKTFKKMLREGLAEIHLLHDTEMGEEGAADDMMGNEAHAMMDEPVEFGQDVGHEEVGGHAEDESMEDHHDLELRMVKSDLYKLAQNAQALCDMMEDCEMIPAWVQSKVATAADRLDSVYHYMAYKTHRK